MGCHSGGPSPFAATRLSQIASTSSLDGGSVIEKPLSDLARPVTVFPRSKSGVQELVCHRLRAVLAGQVFILERVSINVSSMRQIVRAGVR
jgi:hypothetical protein